MFLAFQTVFPVKPEQAMVELQRRQRSWCANLFDVWEMFLVGHSNQVGNNKVGGSRIGAITLNNRGWVQEEW